jgi:alcohol dehydrogenase YqhD (iron-dependent ADH family)
MEKFTTYNPTALHFGKGVTDSLGSKVAALGKRVLLVYGKGSVIKNGTYAVVCDQLRGAGCEIIEYSGIKANPVIEDVNAAAKLGRENKVEVIVAVGGGSTIDSAKIISIGIPVLHDAWDFMIGKVKPKTAIPVVAVLTLAATGTEMNPYAVVQNREAGMKPGYGHVLLYPKHSFLDPGFTLSVPADQTAYGIADLVAHTLEAYFGQGDASLSDRFAYSIIAEAIEYGPALISDLQNYELREKIMWAATCALNGTAFNGRAGGDWGVHEFGHVFSLLYDLPHGASLSIAYPAWLKWMARRIPERIALLGKHLFGATSPEETIEGFERFFTTIGCPTRLSHVNIGTDKKAEILACAAHNKVTGANHEMLEEDREMIFDLMA